MRLYHLTSIYHLPTIFATGYLKVTESNIDLRPNHEHAGPDVVWLTTSNRPGQGWAGMRPGLEHVDKCRVQFEIELPDDEVHLWWPWALAHGSDEWDMQALAAVRDTPERRHDNRRLAQMTPEERELASARARAEWHVVERRIAWPEWVTVYDSLAGSLLWDRTWPGQENATTEGKLIVPRAWADVPDTRLAVLNREDDSRPPINASMRDVMRASLQGGDQSITLDQAAMRRAGIDPKSPSPAIDLARKMGLL